MLYRAAARRAVVHARPFGVVDTSLSTRFSHSSSLHKPSALAAKLTSLFASSRLTLRAYATRSTGTKTRKPAAKKPAKKSAKKPAKKAATKKKKKPAPKKKKQPARKVQTADQKLIEKVRLLKTQALLNEPKYKPTNSWQVLTSQARGQVTADAARERANRYRAMSAGERQELQTTADANKRSNDTLKRQFVERHSPFEIYRANLARNALSRIGRAGATAGRKRKLVARKSFPKLDDPRAPKQPLSGYFRFTQERRQQGNLSGSGIAEESKDATRQWQALPAEERQRYNDIFAFEREEYGKRLQVLMPERFQKKTRSRSRSSSS